MKSMMMSNLTKSLIFAIALFSGTKLMSQGTYHGQSTATFNQAASTNSVTRNVYSNTPSQTKVNYQVSKFEKKSQTLFNSIYQNIYIQGFGQSAKVGQPSVPARTDLIAIPEHSNPKVVITKAVYQDIPNIDLAPVQELESDLEGAQKPAFKKNLTTYSTNKFFPEKLVSISDIQKLKGLPIAFVEINAAQYNPATKTLRIYTDLEYSIQYTGSLKQQKLNSESYSPAQKKILNNVIINKDDLVFGKKNNNNNNPSPSVSYDYIIITHSSFQAAADSLAAWRAQNGYTVEVVSASSWTSAMVKDSIATRYTNYNPKPSYFVIIGDHNNVPAQMISTGFDNFGTDLYYACMDGTGDYIPDMAHGRISVQNSTQAMTAVQKVINYEKNPPASASYYSTGVNFGEFQDDNNDGASERRFTHTNEDIRDYLVSKGYTMNRHYHADGTPAPTHYNNGLYSDGQALPSDLTNGFNWDATTSDVHNELNAGRFMAFHRGHGYTDGWGWVHPQIVSHPSFTYQFSSLNNANQLPIIFSVDCNSGEFTNDECFAEAMLRRSTSGAAGVIAASFESYSGPNDALALGMIDAIWSNPGLVGNFGSGGTSNPIMTAHTDIETMGDVLNQGLLRMVETWNSTTSRNQYQHEIFHYFGDPATKIWKSQPSTIIASSLDTLPHNADYIEITNSNITSGKAILTHNHSILGISDIVNGYAKIDFAVSDSINAVLSIVADNHKTLTKNVRINNSILNNNPAQQASNIQYANNGSADSKSFSFTITWNNGDGNARIVKMNTSNNFTDPTDGVEYDANSNYEGNGEQVVYNGYGSEVTITGVTEGTDYWFRVYEYNNFGEFTKYTTTTDINNPNNQLDQSNNPLPIELINFTASNTDYGVQISWTTASEYNNRHFELQKSYDGSEFETIAKINGRNKTQAESYYFLDKENNSSTVYYRLKQVDFDGKYTLSNVISPSTINATELTNYTVNSNHINLQISSSEDQLITIEFFNLQGQLINYSQNKLIEGQNFLQLPRLNQSNSVVLMRLTTKSNNNTFKIKL